MTPIKFDKINFSTIQFERKEPSEKSYRKVLKQDKLSKSKTPTKPKKEIKSYFYNPIEKDQKGKTEGLIFKIDNSKLPKSTKELSFYEQILSGKKKSIQSSKPQNTNIIIFEDLDEKPVEARKSISNLSQASVKEEKMKITIFDQTMNKSEILKPTISEPEKKPESKFEIIKTESNEKNERNQVSFSTVKKSRTEFLPIQEEATELYESGSMKKTQLKKVESFDAKNKYSNKNFNEEEKFDGKPNPTPIFISEIRNLEQPKIEKIRNSSAFLNVAKDSTENELKEKEIKNLEKESKTNEKIEKEEDDDFYLNYLDEEIKT